MLQSKQPGSQLSQTPQQSQSQSQSQSPQPQSPLTGMHMQLSNGCCLFPFGAPAGFIAGTAVCD